MSYGDGEKISHSSKQILNEVWTVPSLKLMPGGWLWWFWLFFIHDNDTKKTGKCRQIEILWSVKRDHSISVNGLDVTVPVQIIPDGDNFKLDGAVAAWYFDGKNVKENFVLERSMMKLNTNKKSIAAPGKTPSIMMQKDKDTWVTNIKTKDIEFNLIATHKDKHKVNGPHHHSTKYLNGLLRVDGTRIERFELTGREKTKNGKTKPIVGTAYFQKIYLASPPPQWFWGVYHFADGSFLTYMQTYVNLNLLRDNIGLQPELTTPRNLLTSNIIIYHAPSGKVYETSKISVVPKKLKDNLYSHTISGTGDGYSINGVCSAYAHACWTFIKDIGILPLKSTFKYNEYPAVFDEMKITFDNGDEPLFLRNGWGNMENAWGFLL